MANFMNSKKPCVAKFVAGLKKLSIIYLFPLQTFDSSCSLVVLLCVCDQLSGIANFRRTREVSKVERCSSNFRAVELASYRRTRRDPFSFMNKTVITHNFLMTMTYVKYSTNIIKKGRKMELFRMATMCRVSFLSPRTYYIFLPRR